MMFRFVCLILLSLLPFNLLAAQLSPEKTVLLQEQEVRLAVERLVNDKVSGRGWKTSITQLSIPSGIRIPAGTVDMEVTPSPRWDGWGPASMTLLVRVNGRLVKNLSLRINVEAQADMVVASRQIMSGTVLAASDLAIEKHDIAAVNGKYVASMDDAIGKKARGTVRQNSPVRSDQLDKVPVIKSGQTVTIVAESKTLKISTTGKARGSGGVGDIIMVQNLGSQKELSATVVDASTVFVGF